jgi:long-subunit fatty acid transport protein
LGAVGAVTTLLPRSANAGGYDTPILYSARHMGMGGTAIGYVNDPSAMFHNPAGLGGIRGFEVIGNISPLFGGITTSSGSPGDNADAAGNYPTRTTEPAVSPLFLLGAGYRIAEPVTIGIGFYPVAAAAGEYRTRDIRNREMIDKTRLVFMEISPGLSVELAKGLYLGAGYRATIATLERQKGAAADPREFNFTVTGVDAAGFRAGLQWLVSDNFSAGIVYRHKVSPKLTADKVVAATELTNGETTFILPAKMGAGVKGRLDRLNGAFDLEYGFYSQNTTTTLQAVNSLNEVISVPNYFMWQDAITARVGLEYLLGNESNFAARVGYVYDGKVGNKMYPTAFGTPPAPSHSFTVGGGYRADKWQVNVGGAYRFASTSVSPQDLVGAETCPSCSKPGPDYSLKIFGLYLDFSYRFDVAPLFGGATSAANAPVPAVPSNGAPAAPPATPPNPTPTPSSDPAPTPGPTTIPTPTPAPIPTP